MKEGFEVKCPNCENGILKYTTLQGVEYSKKYGVLCKECKNKIKEEKKKIVYKRNCSECNCELITNNKYWNNIAKKENRLCLNCSAKHKIITNEWRENMSKNHADVRGKNNPFYGKKHSKETINKLKEINTGVDRFTNEYKEKLKEKMSGKGNPFYGKKHSKKVIEKLKNITEELRKTRRENRLKQIKESGGIPSFNYEACKYFDELNKQNGWNLQHALNGGEIVLNGYSVDAYDKNKNIVIEYDEPHHYNKRTGKLKYKDLKRQNRIIKYCKCVFFRYNEQKQSLYEVK